MKQLCWQDLHHDVCCCNQTMCLYILLTTTLCCQTAMQGICLGHKYKTAFYSHTEFRCQRPPKWLYISMLYIMSASLAPTLSFHCDCSTDIVLVPLAHSMHLILQWLNTLLQQGSNHLLGVTHRILSHVMYRPSILGLNETQQHFQRLITKKWLSIIVYQTTCVATTKECTRVYNRTTGTSDVAATATRQEGGNIQGKGASKHMQ